MENYLKIIYQHKHELERMTDPRDKKQDLVSEENTRLKLELQAVKYELQVICLRIAIQDALWEMQLSMKSRRSVLTGRCIP
jgi:hypothetical protein